MKIKQMFRWTLEDCRYPLIILYSILMVLYTGFSILTFLLGGDVSFGSLSYSSTIMLFVLGITFCREGLRFSLANGISRRTFFISFLLSMSLLSAIVMLLNSLFTLIFSNFLNMQAELFALLYPGYWKTGNHVMDFLSNGFWTFLLSMLFIILGFFISGVYYRLNRITRILVSVIVPAFFILVLPTVLLIMPVNITRPIEEAVSNFFVFLLQSPYLMGGCFLLLAVVIGFFSWLLIRRAPIKE